MRPSPARAAVAWLAPTRRRRRRSTSGGATASGAIVHTISPGNPSGAREVASTWTRVAAGADPFDQGDDRIEEVLAVVHQEQELAPRGQHGEHRVLDAEVLSLLHIQRRGDGLTEGGRVADRGQLHHRDAVVEVVAGHRQPPRQAGLAHAARPHERDQTIAAHGPGQLRQLLVAPDQRAGIVSDRPAVGADPAPLEPPGGVPGHRPGSVLPTRATPVRR